MLNSVKLIGNTGTEVEVKHFDNGGMVAKFSFATSKSYTNKNSGEKVTNTSWHNIQIFGKKAEIAEKYVNKGDKLYLEGEIEYRSYESDGVTKYVTNIVLGEYDGKMLMLGSKKDSNSSSSDSHSEPAPKPNSATTSESEGSDDLPF